MPTRLPLHLAAACAAVLALSGPAQGVVEAQGPEALQDLLSRYDKQPAGPAKDKLAAQIDAVAHQKYASVSRLYWYTDLPAAQTAARAAKKPILHLRMLGRLDEDLSCANSRLFRTTLYANHEVSAFLRDNFILYWSSERPVPKVTIDYGDGRKLERTLTGNSAHYVLDADGNVLDVLPGVYAPSVFRSELTQSLALASSIRGKSVDDRAKLIVEFHKAAQRQGMSASRKQLVKLSDGSYTMLTVSVRTVSKAAIEIPDQKVIAPETVQLEWSDAAIATRAARGQALFGIKPGARVLDTESTTLVTHLFDAVPAVRGDDKQRAAMLARLERALVADSVMNEEDLRPMASAKIIDSGGQIDFSTLNTFVYSKVFLTPAADPWLGLLPRTDFVGLPGDGVVMR
jgi:hypothetical protein